MLDLSTINATTIADPATLQAVEAEVGVLRETGDSIGASTLRGFLERQITGSLDHQISAKYQAIIDNLGQITDVGENRPRPAPDETERVPINDGSGRLRYLSSQGFVDIDQSDPSEPPLQPVSLHNSVSLRQAAINQRSDKRLVPVAYDLPEDEEEIRAHNNRLNSFNLGDGHDISGIIDRIIEQRGVKLEDAAMLRRFRTISETRLKEIRTSREVRELFVRPPKIGGLGLSSEVADAVIVSLEQGAEEIREGLSAVKPKSVSTAPAPTPAPPKVPQEVAIPQPIPEPSAPKVVIPVPVAEAPKPVTAPPAPTSSFRPVLSRPAVQTYRPLVEDIKPPISRSRLVGPLEELSSLGIDDFRRWGGGDAAASVRKVYEKISLLGEESFGRRVEGVANWKQSPLYALYLTMSQESLEQGKDIQSIVSAREAAGQPTLSEAEFHAIIDLNRQLRY